MLLALTLCLTLAQAEPAPLEPPPPRVKVFSAAATFGLASLAEAAAAGLFVGLAALQGGDSAGYFVVAGLLVAPAAAWVVPYSFGSDGLDALGWSYLGGALSGIVCGTIGWLYGSNGGPAFAGRSAPFIWSGLFGFAGQMLGSPLALALAQYFRQPPQVAVLPVRGGGVFSVAMRF